MVDTRNDAKKLQNRWKSERFRLKRQVSQHLFRFAICAESAQDSLSPFCLDKTLHVGHLQSAKNAENAK